MRPNGSLALFPSFGSRRFCPDSLLNLLVSFDSEPATRIASCARCPLSVHHFWAGDKPWWLHYTRCPEYFAFLSGVKKSTRCASWLHHRLERAKSLPANWTCGGIKQCVF